MNWWQQVILGIVLVFAIQGFKFGPSQAHIGVGRILLKWTFRVGGFFASHKDKAWVTPGASEPPSGRLALFQSMLSGKHEELMPPSHYPECVKTGKLAASELQFLRTESWMRSDPPPALNRMLQELVPDGHERPADADGFPGSIWLDTDLSIEDDSAPILIYLHMGGGVAASPKNDIGFAYSLHKATGFRTLAFKYPLAPEHPAPAAGKALAAAIAKLGNDRKIVLVGLSAGAYPAIQAVLDGNAKPAAVVILAGLISGKPLPSHAAHAATDLTSLKLLRCFQEASYPSGSVTLLERDWSAAAKIPFFFQVGQTEMLVDDSRMAAAKLAEAGNKVTKLELVPHISHGVIMEQDIVPEANVLLLRVREWIKEQMK